MSAEHTPGPWSYHEHEDAYCGHCCTPNGCSESHPAGQYYIEGPDFDHTDGDHRISNEADARLITAAPELLAALATVPHPLCGVSDIGRWWSDNGELLTRFGILLPGSEATGTEITSPAPEKARKWERALRKGQLVRHEKSGGLYRIVLTWAADGLRLEGTDRPAYAYRIAAPTGGNIWVRDAEEMEDGRFVVVPEPVEGGAE